MFEVENFDLKHCFLCKVLDILKKRIVIDLEKFCKCHQFRDSDIISSAFYLRVTAFRGFESF